jgi:hypothetical protein
MYVVTTNTWVRWYRFSDKDLDEGGFPRTILEEEEEVVDGAKG